MPSEDGKETWKADAAPVMDQEMAGQDAKAETKGGNVDDHADMLRMGKVQEMKRNFRFLTIFGFSMVLVATWESAYSVASLALTNGGTAGFIWMFLLAWIGFCFINLSMAEMGSMAPTTGGQYHWVSEFAPRKYQKFLSYIMGWLCVLGWQTSCASSSYLSGTEIQGLIALNNPDYVFERWHGTLLTIACAGFSVIFNTTLSRKLPLIEGIILIIHVFAFFGIIVTLWVLAPRADSHDVFTQFTDGGGWGSVGGSTLVGLGVACVLPQLGADAAVHMSEELQDAGRTLPQSMIWSTIVNGLSGWVMIITFCFTLGNLQEDLASPTGYPFLTVFYNATGSRGSATAMAVFPVVMIVCSNMTVVATASRQLYAFARDDAVPFSKWFSKVHPRFNIPFNAILTTFVVSSLLSLINIGSPTALNSITSLGTNALLSSYITSIGCMVWRRWSGNPILPSKFSLGRYGLPINIVSEVFLILFFVMAFFPSTPNPSLEDMNWNILIYGFVVLGSLLYFYLHGRHQYVGPVEYVRKLE